MSLIKRDYYANIDYCSSILTSMSQEVGRDNMEICQAEGGMLMDCYNLTVLKKACLDLVKHLEQTPILYVIIIK